MDEKQIEKQNEWEYKTHVRSVSNQKSSSENYNFWRHYHVAERLAIEVLNAQNMSDINFIKKVFIRSILQMPHYIDNSLRQNVKDFEKLVKDATIMNYEIKIIEDNRVTACDTVSDFESLKNWLLSMDLPYEFSPLKDVYKIIGVKTKDGVICWGNLERDLEDGVVKIEILNDTRIIEIKKN